MIEPFTGLKLRQIKAMRDPDEQYENPWSEGETINVELGDKSSSWAVFEHGEFGVRLAGRLEFGPSLNQWDRMDEGQKAELLNEITACVAEKG